MTGTLLARAKAMRSTQTPAEARLWTRLRNKKLKGAKFKRQVPMGPFIADFVCFEAKLIIEADGGQHAVQEGYDAQRTSWLEAQGFIVMRFWNMDILGDTDAVIDAIAAMLHSRLQAVRSR